MTKVAISHEVNFKGEPKRWWVTANCCETDPFALLLRPWIVTHAWSDAVWWANWHAAEHQRLVCPCCGHSPKVASLTPLDQNTVRIGGDRLFRRVRGGWTEVVTAGQATMGAAR